MKVLFLPHSFPGPFRSTASKLAALKNAKVLCVTGRTRSDVRIPGVRRILVNQPPTPTCQDRAEYEAVRGIRRANHMANALMRLKSSGFVPDMVIANVGHGYSLYLKDIFPTSFLVAYAEGYHTHGNTFTYFSKGKTHPSLDVSPDRVRNFFQWSVLSDSHMIYTSTQWQKSLYPESLSKDIQVFHEGIDTDFFVPKAHERFNIEGCDLSHVEELVTFSGRSMPANQAFPTFLNSIPAVLEQRPQCHVLVMTSNPKHTQEQSKEWIKALQEQHTFDDRRLHFIPFRPYQDYRKLLQASQVHIFLSAPLALSSGLFEAMSCGCLVLGPDTGPVNEILKHGENGFIYQQNNTELLSEMIVTNLERQQEMSSIREAARRTITENYNIHTQAQKTVDTLLKNYAAWKKSHA